MAQPSPQLRKIEPAVHRPVDERLWPIQTGLLVLGGYLAALAANFLPWDGPLLTRAATGIAIAVAGTLALMGLAAWATHRPGIRRSMWLSLVISLLLNLSLMVGMGFVYVFGHSPLREPVSDQRQIADVVVPLPIYDDRVHEQPVDAKQPWDEPAATGPAEAEQVDVEHQPDGPEQPQELVSRSDGATETPSVELQQPSRREMPSAPRLSELPNLLSRSIAQTVPETSRAARGIAEQQQPRPPQLATSTDRPADIARSTDTPAAPPLEQLANAATPTPNANLELARPESEPEVVPTTSSQPARMPRDIMQPRSAPRAALPVDAPSQTPSATAQEELQPTPLDAGISRQPTASPAPALVVLEPDAVEPTPSTDIRLQQRRSDDRQISSTDENLASLTIQRAPTAPPELNTTRVPRSEPRAVADNSDSETPTPTEPQLAAADTAVDRSAPSSNPTQPTQVDPQTATSNSAATPDPTAALRSQPTVTRAEESPAEPNDSPATEIASSGQQIPITAERAPMPATAERIVVQASPAGTDDGSAREPAAEPAPLALAQGSADRSLSGAGPSLNDDLPSPPTPSQLASSTAQRDESTQAEADSTALTPSALSPQPRFRAESAQPTTSSDATPLNVPSDVAAAREDQQSVSASATSVAASANNVPAGPITAAAGEQLIDVGPPQIASSVGQRRGASGGDDRPDIGEPAADGRSSAANLARREPSRAAGPRAATTASQVDPSEFERAGTPSANNVENSANPAPQSLANQPAPNGPSAAAPPAPAAASSDSSANSSGDSADRAAAALANGPAVRRATESDQPGEMTGAEPAPAWPDVPRRGAAGRTAATPSLPTPNVDDVPQITGEPILGAASDGHPLQASAVSPKRSLSGAAQALPADRTGAAAGDPNEPGTIAPDSIPSLTVPRASAADGSSAFQVTSADSGIPAPRQPSNQVPAGAQQPVRLVIPGVRREDEDAPSLMEELMASELATGGPQGDEPSSIVVINQREEGPGGLGTLASTDAGMLTRRAQEESQVIAAPVDRFVRREIASPIATETSVVNPAAAFQQRSERRGRNGAAPGGAQGPKTEEAIELGLAYLARQQRADGRWTLAEKTEGDPTAGNANAGPAPTLRSDTAATGLALLSFLGAGYHHREFKYQDHVDRGLQFLIARQTAEGDYFAPEDPVSNRSVWMYSHAIATLAVCEAYGMTRDPKLKESAEAGLRFIASSQHAERGGWRYAPLLGSDTSVTGWMMMALKSGELAGLTVDPGVYQRIGEWLDGAEVRTTEGVRYVYNPLAPDTVEQRHGRQGTPAMTSVGGLMRMYSGWDRRRAELRGIGDYLLDHPPTLGTATSEQRDTYYWYYATQVMFHLGGDYWKSWNDQLHPLLLRTQAQRGPLAGSWDPHRPVADKWARHAGRLYVTAMNLMSLEVTYRHLPLYDTTAR
ncbi:MAG: hypothetical protein U0795_02990 [Pirellulales bacterium]